MSFLSQKLSQASTIHAFCILHAFFINAIPHHLSTHAYFHFLDIPYKTTNTNPERLVLHQYYTQSKARVMEKDQASRVEQLEKAHLELREKLAKSCDDISQMMEMLKILTREKQTIEASSSQPKTTSLRGFNGDATYSQGLHYLART